MTKKKDWYPAFIKRLVAQELKDQEAQSEAWLRENEARGRDPEVIKANKRFIRFAER